MEDLERSAAMDHTDGETWLHGVRGDQTSCRMAPSSFEREIDTVMMGTPVRDCRSGLAGCPDRIVRHAGRSPVGWRQAQQNVWLSGRDRQTRESGLVAGPDADRAGPRRGAGT
ncbi:hypothetical protein SAMN04488003_108156 [Loktanella fryxellensis]|uniref:Uncharacterized protein n=1 Tax=Loktanella fryxellensis TaxID=245187 RepID=A0A1H8DIB2_9RHOB|nr:hypothetical protein SAMN04488003_108156 [Loktanella fryxellensis]